MTSLPVSLKHWIVIGSHLVSRSRLELVTILGPHAPYGAVTIKTEDSLDDSDDCSKHAGWDAALETYTGPVMELTTGVPYRCWSCRELNRPVPPKRHHAVIRGRHVGVFEGW
jgi:hypothetical protein